MTPLKQEPINDDQAISALDQERLALLMGNSTKLEFSDPQSMPEMDALDFLKNLSPRKRTELLTELWYNAQQQELARVGGW